MAGNVNLPLQKTATAENLPESGLGDHNFCRNPDRDARGVWCYAVGDEATKQFCNVPNCTVDDAFIIESDSITSSSTSLSDVRSTYVYFRWSSPAQERCVLCACLRFVPHVDVRTETGRYYQYSSTSLYRAPVYRFQAIPVSYTHLTLPTTPYV